MSEEPDLSSLSNANAKILMDRIMYLHMRNSGSKFGLVIMQTCVLFDNQLTARDKGIYAIMCATEEGKRMKFNGSKITSQKDERMLSMLRLQACGYITTEISGDDCEHLHVTIVDPPDVLPVQKRKNPNLPTDEDVAEDEAPPPPLPVLSKQALASYTPFNALNPECVPNNLTPELWEAFIKFRREHKYSCKKAHCARMKEKIEGYGAKGRECVEFSMANGYMGLFPPKSSSADTASRTRQILTDINDQEREDQI